MGRRIWTVVLASSCALLASCAPPVTLARHTVDPRMLDTLTATPIDASDAAARASAVAHFRAHQEQVRLKYTRQTWEADPIHEYVLVHDGTARWIHDARSDSFEGPEPRISDCALTALRLAVVLTRGGPWIEIAPDEISQYQDQRIYLRGRADCPGRKPFEIYF